MVNQNKNFLVKPCFEKLKKSKQNFEKKNIRKTRNFGGLDATNELKSDSTDDQNFPIES